MHTTNYYNTLIEIAEDSQRLAGEAPPERPEKPTIADLQFAMIRESPYKFTSDEVIFSVYARRKDFPESDWEKERQRFFSKGQACLRSSPLTKRYGWGVHFDAEGKIALVDAASEEYERMLRNNAIKKVKAMRSSRK